MGRGDKSLLCGPGSELRQGGREKRRAKITNGMVTKKRIGRRLHLPKISSFSSPRGALSRVLYGSNVTQGPVAASRKRCAPYIFMATRARSLDVGSNRSQTLTHRSKLLKLCLHVVFPRNGAADLKGSSQTIRVVQPSGKMSDKGVRQELESV